MLAYRNGRVRTGYREALLYSLVASGQINLRRLDGYEKLVDVVSREQDVAA